MLKFCYFSSKMDDVQLDQNMAMDDMWRALHVLQQENKRMRREFEQLHARAPPAPQNPEGAINQQVL
jgi:hypothetical protein